MYLIKSHSLLKRKILSFYPSNFNILNNFVIWNDWNIFASKKYFVSWMLVHDILQNRRRHKWKENEKKRKVSNNEQTQRIEIYLRLNVLVQCGLVNARSRWTAKDCPFFRRTNHAWPLRGCSFCVTIFRVAFTEEFPPECRGDPCWIQLNTHIDTLKTKFSHPVSMAQNI